MDGPVARLRVRAAAAAAALGFALAMTACGDDDATDPVPTDPPGAEAPGSEQDSPATMEVLAPAAGETVQVPFPVRVDTDVELGPIDSERHHLHVWFDDDQEAFELHESEDMQIETAPEGETTLWVQVHTFDHQPASEPVGVTLTVLEGTG